MSSNKIQISNGELAGQRERLWCGARRNCPLYQPRAGTARFARRGFDGRRSAFGTRYPSRQEISRAALVISAEKNGRRSLLTLETGPETLMAPRTWASGP